MSRCRRALLSALPLHIGQKKIKLTRRRICNGWNGLEAKKQIFGPCPKWVNSGHAALKLQCPLYPRKQTSVGAIWMSALANSRHRRNAPAALTMPAPASA
jgi:hypothetical protein